MNKSRILEGQRHGCLTQKGLQQAQALSFWFERLKIDGVLSSDQTRAIQTADPIVEQSQTVRTILRLTDLRERSLGLNEGQKAPFKTLEGVESLDNLVFRAKNALTNSMTHFQNCVCVTHSGLIQHWIKSLDPELPIHCPNASVSLLRFQDNTWKVIHAPTTKFFHWKLPELTLC